MLYGEFTSAEKSILLSTLMTPAESNSNGRNPSLGCTRPRTTIQNPYRCLSVPVPLPLAGSPLLAFLVPVPSSIF